MTRLCPKCDYPYPEPEGRFLQLNTRTQVVTLKGWRLIVAEALVILMLVAVTVAVVVMAGRGR